MGSQALVGQVVAEKQKSPTFTLDGEPLDLATFIDDNGLEAEQVAAIFQLQPGETMNFGGGAAATFVLRCEGFEAAPIPLTVVAPPRAPSLTLSTEADRTVILASKAGKCACGAMATVLVNRGGRTRCVRCDAQYKAEEIPAGAGR